jgi:predicted secreted hydrolase
MMMQMFSPGSRFRSSRALLRTRATWCVAAWLVLFSFSPVSVSQVGPSGSRPPVEDTTWRLALPGYGFSFPRDHFAHEPYRLEWWYYTGNVETGEGRRLGYQLTFFRVGVAFKPENPSRWAIRDLHLAHFAISDVSHESFKFF